MHAYMQAYIHTYIHTRSYLHTHTHVHTYLHTCIHTNIHTYMYTNILTHIRLHAYMHTCIHAYMHAINMCNQCTQVDTEPCSLGKGSRNLKSMRSNVILSKMWKVLGASHPASLEAYQKSSACHGYLSCRSTENLTGFNAVKGIVKCLLLPACTVKGSVCLLRSSSACSAQQELVCHGRWKHRRACSAI